MDKLNETELGALHAASRKVRKLETERALASAELEAMLALTFATYEKLQGVHQLCIACGAFFRQGTPCGCAPVAT